jgi:hypothetical protein
VHGMCFWHVEIARPQYHASMTRGPQDVCRPGGLRMSAHVLGGANGCAFQLYLWQCS